MSQTGTEQFVCEGCGRSYRWKPELAGRKVKCKCGQVMIAPEGHAPAMVEEEELYSLAGETKARRKHSHIHLPEGTEHCPACNAFLVIGAKICVQCGFDLVTGKAPPKPTMIVDDGTAALKDEPPKPAKVVSPKPVHPPVAVKRPEAKSEAAGPSRKKLYLWIALGLAGLAAVVGVSMSLFG